MSDFRELHDKQDETARKIAEIFDRKKSAPPAPSSVEPHKYEPGVVGECIDCGMASRHPVHAEPAPQPSHDVFDFYDNYEGSRDFESRSDVCEFAEAYAQSELSALRTERDDWKRKFEELTPEDIRGMAWDTNALLEKENESLKQQLAAIRGKH